MTDDSERARVVQSYGQTTLPWQVRLAIVRLTRRGRADPAVWLLAARTLALTSSSAWAYRCYRRAARLAPQDFGLAEEVGLFGARRLTRQYSRSWPVYLTRARQDPLRRRRVDPLLLPMARRLPAELSLWATVMSVVAAMVGAYAVRRGYPLERTIPEGYVPFAPLVGCLTATGVVVVFGGLVWLMFQPVRRFGREILGQALRRPRLVHASAVLGAVTSVVGGVVVAGYGASPMFDTYATWLLPVWGVSFALALAGLPIRDVLAAALQTAGDVVVDVARK